MFTTLAPIALSLMLLGCDRAYTRKQRRLYARSMSFKSAADMRLSAAARCGLLTAPSFNWR